MNMKDPGSITPEALENNLYAVHLSGEIDVNYLPQLENVVKPITDIPQLNGIVLDCKNLLFIDSKIVGFIAYLYTKLSRAKQKLIIAETNETVNDILILVGLTTIIPFSPTLAEAINQINVPVAQ